MKKGKIFFYLINLWCKKEEENIWKRWERKMDRGRRNHFIKLPNGAIKKCQPSIPIALQLIKTPDVLISQFPQSQIKDPVNFNEKMGEIEKFPPTPH